MYCFKMPKIEQNSSKNLGICQMDDVERCFIRCCFGPNHLESAPNILFLMHSMVTIPLISIFLYQCIDIFALIILFSYLAFFQLITRAIIMRLVRLGFGFSLVLSLQSSVSGSRPIIIILIHPYSPDLVQIMLK